MCIGFWRAIALSFMSGVGVFAASAQPLTAAFTYQGELASGGSAATGTYDLRFRLYDALGGGNQVGSTVCADNIDVVSGRFAVSLDFGAAFAGQKRFLEIEVREDAGLGCGDASGYVVLSSRQELMATPNATFAKAAETATTALTASNATSLNGQSAGFYQNAANLTGALPSAGLSGTYGSALTLNNAANIFTGNGAAITNLSATNISTGVLAAARMPTNWAASGDLGGFFPSPTINAGVVTLSKLAPSVQGVLSKLNSLTPAPTPLDVLTWGQNYYYSQGNIPALPPGITYTAVSAGYGHGLALRSDGAVVGWGYNLGGQINIPELPPGVTYTAVAGGGFHSLALRSDATVVGWGSNAFGQLNVPALPPGVTYTAVAASFDSSFALRSDGTIVAWGKNNQGQTDVPALPPGLSYTAVVSNGGADHGLGLRSDGSVAAWGRNAEGQLNVPSLPPGVKYTSVAAGSTHNLGMVSDGGVVAWGGTGNNYGQVSGLGPPPSGVTYTAVAAGYRHSLALRSDGAIVAWGNPAFGVTSVPALPSGVVYTAVAAANNQTIAFRGVPQSPSLGAADGLSIGSNTPPPANGGISVAGSSSFAAGVSAASFTGSGAGLTNLSASNTTTGTLADARLSSNVALKNAANVFTSTGVTSFAGNLGIGAPVPIQTLDVNGRINVTNGVIQRGGAAVTGTSDLGLYSQVASSYMRFVTSNGEFHWYSDGGIGTADRMILFPNGNLSVAGSLSKGGGSFKIDHPLDPENKYLYHSFVESPDMMNVYNGNVILDALGQATVELPDYFEALNRDFRYQLTCIGGFAPVFISQKVQGNSFAIAGGSAGLEVSWQVTGIRHDAWAEKNRIPNSVEKVGAEKGKYLHPAAFGKRVEEGDMHPVPGRGAHSGDVPAGGSKR